MEYKKIWKKVLSPDEQVKYEFSISKKYRLSCAFAGYLAGIILAFTPGYYIGGLVALASFLYFIYFLKVSNAYAFTNKRVVIYRGWITSELISIDYNKITEVVVEQKLLGTITKSGDLIINTAGGGSPENKMDQRISNIDDPYETKKKLDQIRTDLK
jgi:uncharacterized membrane protein YdbT with pleckstrin-like domain